MKALGDLPITLHFTPVKQGFSLNLDLGKGPVSLRESRLHSTSYRAKVTDSCSTIFSGGYWESISDSHVHKASTLTYQTISPALVFGFLLGDPRVQ